VVTVRLPVRRAITPAAITLDPDHPEAAIEAAVVDADGSSTKKEGSAFAWSSSAETVAVVSAGRVKLAGPGQAKVEIRYGDLRAEVPVISLGRREALGRGCDAGALDRCAALARLLDQGGEVEVDHAAAAALFQKACDGGSARACAELGARAEAESAPDLVKIAAIYQKACDAQDPYGCARLGRLYETGLGVVGSSARALGFYRAACDAGEPEGCYRLAGMVELARGVVRDAPAAAELYKKACDGGHLAACAGAANMYLHGSGTLAKDVAAAIALYDKACDAKHEPACTVMALEYKSGGGVEADAAKSLAYFAKACAAGSKPACVIAAQR
jgi:TPR repeat protein